MRIVTGLSWLIATPSDWFPWYQMVSGPKDQMQLRCRRCHHRFFFSTVSHCPITVEYLWESHDCPLKPLFFQCCTTTATHFLRHPSDKALRFFIPRKLVTAHAMRQRECKKSKKDAGCQHLRNGDLFEALKICNLHTIFFGVFPSYSTSHPNMIPLFSTDRDSNTMNGIASAHPMGWTSGHTWITWYASQESQMDDRLG